MTDIQRLQTQHTELKHQVDAMEGKVTSLDSKIDALVADNNVNFARLFRTLGVTDPVSEDMDLDTDQGKRKHSELTFRAADTP